MIIVLLWKIWIRISEKQEKNRARFGKVTNGTLCVLRMCHLPRYFGVSHQLRNSPELWCPKFWLEFHYIDWWIEFLALRLNSVSKPSSLLGGQLIPCGLNLQSLSHKVGLPGVRGLRDLPWRTKHLYYSSQRFKGSLLGTRDKGQPHFLSYIMRPCHCIFVCK